jgi:hypothetical protein
VVEDLEEGGLQHHRTVKKEQSMWRKRVRGRARTKRRLDLGWVPSRGKGVI